MLERVELGGQDTGRYYYAHVPQGEALPLVLAFHGGGSTPLDMARFCHLVELAQHHRFAVVFPSGSGPSPEYLTWNAGICCGHASGARWTTSASPRGCSMCCSIATT